MFIVELVWYTECLESLLPYRAKVLKIVGRYF